MRGRFINRAVSAILLVCQISACLGQETADPNQSSKYLDAVREFADNVLKYGRDTYGPKHTPLFVDGLNTHTHKPVEWIDPDGTRWILSNFASQQTLMRTLDKLSQITGDSRYRDAAMQAIKYAFENLQAPNGLIYWGHAAAYDAQADRVYTEGNLHSLKLTYPYYELMWEVDPNATKGFIEAYWSAHILDWSILDIDRMAKITKHLEEPWNHEYKGGPTFFKSKSGAIGSFIPATSLVHAGTILHKLSGHEQPLLWSKRLVKHYVDTRHPKTKISAFMYNSSWKQLGEDMKEHFVDPYTTIFPFDFYEWRYLYYPENTQAHPWMSIFLVGRMLGVEGREFTRWALEELTAWGRVSYRKRDNSFVPMLTDGTSVEGYVWEEGPSRGTVKNVIKPYPADASFFWTYSVAYSTTSDEFMWKMARAIALGNKYGDIGESPSHTPKLITDTTYSGVYGLLGFLELHRKTKSPEFLKMAQRIGNNIVNDQLYKGFFVPSKRHIYTRFDCFEPLALLHLHAAITSEMRYVPQVWPSSPLFVPAYRYKQRGVDRRIIYTLTDSPEPPLSLQEAAVIGDIELVRSLLDKGVGVDSWDDPSRETSLQRAAMAGHKEVVELLIAKGARVDTQRNFPGVTALDYAAEKGHKEIAEFLLAKGANVNAKRKGYPVGDTPLHSAVRAGHKDIVELLIAKGADVNAINNTGDTPLHTAARAGHKDIVELLIAKGADINAKNNEGQTPLDIAITKNRKDIIDLLVEKGAVPSSIHAAVRVGVLARVKALLGQGVDVNAQDDKGITPLHSAVRSGHKDIVELLIAKGADVNGKDNYGYTPLSYAIWYENKDIIKLLVSKGADVNLKPEKNYPPLHHAVWNEDIDTVKLLVAAGAKFDVKDRDGWTVFRYAAARGNRDIVEFFIAKGADVSSFHMAACMGDLTRVKRFVEQGADVDTKDELGWTPLYWAASTGQENVAEFLIAKGANIHTKTNYGTTILYQAAQAGARELAELLISRGADVNTKGKYGNTPLHRAASAGHREVVELLIAKGATVNAKGRNDWTPLHSATMSGHKDVVEFLIAKGAEVDVEDKWNLTALWWANRRGHKEIVELLRKHGAKE